MKECIILMADIIGSRKADQAALMNDFKDLVAEVNKTSNMLSPLTITLGDEFQGLLEGAEDALKVIWKLEETIVEKELNFKLRYVVVEGFIETPFNKEIAYGVMG